ncbi:OmpW/AlkL family protein [Allorhizobium sp. NPDC080224]|jgi:outer membrane protein|uniref:Outer membrane protein n=2 Tax=Alphaproteobacteria TaxID=28211 RepID=A0A512HKM9_9HYPH|nr:MULTISPECIES: OmpW family outer membrane protein [Alphaproteobacteria]GEO86009.1 outer membrane protein [Ciceribacter naphthalenivorans]GLR23516.1 outer membrane protein [Ciceribacter naphthalenivorans]GLT06372.1 outer membrane protein [Sphingomonas psychrolutea]
MRQIGMITGLCLSIAVGIPALAQEADHNGWYVRGGPVGIFFSPGVDLSVSGAPVPGADVSVDDNYSMSFDIGYRLNEQFSTTFTFGIPPTAEIRGSGALSGAYLGDLTYAPAILALQYRIPTGMPKFEPYIGAGINYTIVLDEKGRDVANFSADNAWGVVLQAGFETMINDRLGLYVDVKKIWLETDVGGTLGAGGPAADAKATLNPLLVGTGLIWRF